METLDIQHHSLGVLAVLSARLSVPTTAATQDNRFSQVQDFIMGCNGEQIRLAPEMCKSAFLHLYIELILLVTVAELCHTLTAHLVEQKTPMKGIPLLIKAITKLQLFDSQLTSIHADMCQLCLLGKCFKPALEILDNDITGICQEVSVHINFCCYFK